MHAFYICKHSHSDITGSWQLGLAGKLSCLLRGSWSLEVIWCSKCVFAADEQPSPSGTLFWGGKGRGLEEDKVPMPLLDTLFGSDSGKMMMALEVMLSLAH